MSGQIIIKIKNVEQNAFRFHKMLVVLHKKVMKFMKINLFYQTKFSEFIKLKKSQISGLLWTNGKVGKVAKVVGKSNNFHSFVQPLMQLLYFS